MTVLLAAGFVFFMGLIRSVHALDDYALARFGYAPFALPNVLFMLIPNALLLLIVEGDLGYTAVPATLAGAATLGMLLLVKRRTNAWIALFAAPPLLLAAPVLVFAVLFRGLAQAGGGRRD